MISQAEQLGEWLGLAKLDANKVVRKQRKCATLAIREFPDEITEEEVKFIMDSI